MNNLSIYKLIPNVSSDTIQKYLNDIKDIPLQTKDEEVYYLKLLNTSRHDEAVQKLMESNLRYVITIAKQYQYNHIHDFQLEDLIQIGNIGLYKGILAYNDPDFKVRLSTYVTYKIRGEILDNIVSDKKGIHIPIYKTDQISKINKFISDYEQKNEYEPSVEEIADQFNIPVEEIINIQLAKSLSIEGEKETEEGDTILSLIPNTEESNSSYINKCVQNCIFDNLSERDSDILCKAFGIQCEKLPIEVIAQEYGITDRRVNTIISRCLCTLRDCPELQQLV